MKTKGANMIALLEGLQTVLMALASLLVLVGLAILVPVLRAGRTRRRPSRGIEGDGSWFDFDD